MNKYPLLVFLVLLLLGASCSSKKKLVNTQPATVDYEWMTAKATMDLSAPGAEFKNVSGIVQMRRDSVIWISASAFMGMENVRALVTQDSVVMINRVDQTYFVEPLEEVAAKFQWPATLREIQAKLLGEHAELRFGPYTAKIRYSDIHWNEPTTFPIKINKNYERIKL